MLWGCVLCGMKLGLGLGGLLVILWLVVLFVVESLFVELVGFVGIGGGLVVLGSGRVCVVGSGGWVFFGLIVGVVGGGGVVGIW